MRTTTLAAILIILCAGCGDSPPPRTQPTDTAPDPRGHTVPSRATQEANAAVASRLQLGDPQDRADVERGLVASEPDLVITGADGGVIWDTGAYDFITGAAPPSVNPSLWRQAQLNNVHGLFKVTDGVYQVRGYDISNLSLIQGRSGWIVVDPLTSRETASAAMALARKHLGEVNVNAIIFTHSHMDHFGGIEGVLPGERAGDVRIVAPRGFVEEATSENVMAGLAMGRRATYMYGMPLARDARGHVDSGLGKQPARGGIGILPPTDVIDHTPQELVIDGVRFVFQYAPESEAPAELTFYLPHAKAFCGAEILSHTLHNLYTLRGAKVRDAVKWSGYIDDALHRFGDAEVVFASHHWPVWGNARVIDYMKKQRDAYRYIHDQTLRLANDGYTPREIAETLELPESLRTVFANRDYYGTVRHNVKAVYQAYFGWFDGNPAQLDPLPPVDIAVKYVAAMGGTDAVLRQGREAVAAGDYRWAATLLDHLVFADPHNDTARELLAQAYDQLGYQAESGPWRDVYLTGALELRRGVTESGVDLKAAAGLLQHLPADRFFAAMSVRLNGPKADGKRMTINFVFTDLNESYVIELENGVLHHRQSEPLSDANATVRLTRDFLVRLMTAQAGLRDFVFSNDLEVEGSRMDVLGFFSLLERAGSAFAIVTP